MRRTSGDSSPQVEHPLVDLWCHQANAPVVEAPLIVLSPPNTVLKRGDGNR